MTFSINGSDTNAGADTGPPHTYWRVSPSGDIQRLADGAIFYGSLFAESDIWDGIRANATSFALPGQEGARQVCTDYVGRSSIKQLREEVCTAIYLFPYDID